MGIQGFLNRKYSVLEQNANTAALAERTRADLGFGELAQRGIAVRADANLANTRAALLPAEAASTNALRGAQTANVTQTTDLLPERAFTDNRGGRATSALQESLNLPITPVAPGAVGVGGGFGRGATTLDQVIADRQRRGMPALSGSLGLQGPDDILDVTPRVRMGFAKGTARVPGKGSGKKDTVPAKLAPGEAVLNKAAADMAGRGAIAKLNAAGARKMGMV